MAARFPSGPAPEGIAPPIVHDVLRSPGQALDEGTRQFLEPRFGRDFSGVRVHAGPRAAEAASSVNARAFTVGHNIVLGRAHSPASTSGLGLVAHELAHTTQQTVPPALEQSIEIGSTDHPAEQEADQLSSSALRGEPQTPATQAGEAIQLRRDDTDKPAPKPLIPAPKPLRPFVDSIDPSVTTPLGSGSLEDAHKAWDALRGAGKSSTSGGGADCRGMLGFQPGSGSYKGQCCRGSIQSETNCCPPGRMSVPDQRCCTSGEALRDNHCVKKAEIDKGPPPELKDMFPKPLPKPPMQEAPVPLLPPGQAYA
jgi:hypothetical protein